MSKNYQPTPLDATVVMLSALEPKTRVTNLGPQMQFIILKEIVGANISTPVSEFFKIRKPCLECPEGTSYDLADENNDHNLVKSVYQSQGNQNLGGVLHQALTELRSKGVLQVRGAELDVDVIKPGIRKRAGELEKIVPSETCQYLTKLGREIKY
ncbi:MAG: hypothetical protein KKH52_03770 [Nanoarchaeota archaeon]|nr:hypothetical protein [Nanoarchaeota archaeon]MBU1623218.1 hypothetical protein [Nanoarchaeota archaeon]MBU1974486.1 hypothetical protein [Nanoarchaeota archaeon]